MQAFEDAGIDLDLIARGVASGKLSYENLGLFLPEACRALATGEELRREVRRSPELIAASCASSASPSRSRDGRCARTRSRPQGAPRGLGASPDEDELARLARVYGQNILKVVAVGSRARGCDDLRRLRQEGYSDEEMREGRGRRTPPHEPREQLMLWLRGRHLEHEILAVTVQTTEDYLQEIGLAGTNAQSARDRLSRPDGYTALTEERGDEAGADLADRLATLVHEAARPHGGNPVKWLGDGVMFHFDDPSAAVLTGLDLVEQTPAGGGRARARVGINAGNVIFRDGDYFGRTVNVASRIADYARPGEVLVSGEVKERCGGDGRAVRRDRAGGAQRAPGRASRSTGPHARLSWV
jgi:hypothetical protein